MTSPSDMPPPPLLVPALAKAMSIIDIVAREPGITFSQIQKNSGLAKSSTHQLISSLCQLGLLQVSTDGKHMLGLRLFELGSIAASQRIVEREALPYLRALTNDVQLTCHLGVLEGHEAVYLAKVDGNLPIKVNTWVGKRVSLYSSSLGKALLAWLPELQLDQVLTHVDWRINTPNTLPDARALKEHLALVRSRGWATDDEEDVPNIRCVSAPIRDMRGNVIAAISAVGTILQIDVERFPELAAQVCATAEKISTALGHR
ncbi:IclR family transcriptional regulator [Telmatospirillum siberiense]|nr:IclR family transcriptional regulator [Telmatospirillum siberiense]